MCAADFVALISVICCSHWTHFSFYKHHFLRKKSVVSSRDFKINLQIYIYHFKGLNEILKMMYTCIGLFILKAIEDISENLFKKVMLIKKIECD
jgi:hypothetical protein